MITQLPSKEKSTVMFRFNKKITVQDYDYLLPMLEDKIERHGKLKLYCEFDNVAGIERNVAIRDGKFFLNHRHNFKKIAVVGVRKWVKQMMQLGDYLYSGELKHFEKSHANEALKWLKK